MTPGDGRPLDAAEIARHQEALAAARAAENAGDEAGAEAEFRRVLAATRGSGELVAWVALANLTGLFQRQGRESETLILLRRLLEGAAPFEPFRAVWTRQALCMALANLEAWDRLRDELPRFAAGIAACPEPHRTIFARSALALRATLALQRGTVEEARALHSELAAGVDETAAPNTRRFVILIGAEVEVRARRLREAVDAARAARAFCSSPVEVFASAVVEAECLFELDGAAAARDVVRDALDRLDAWSGPPRAAALLVKAGPRLAAIAEKCGDAGLTRRSFDVAGAALLRRVVEVERAHADLPELADPAREDAETLAEFRARFADDKRRFLTALARVLGDPVAAAAFLRPGGEFLRVCAWCLRALGRDGAWFPLGHLFAGASHELLTHGICEACAHRVAAGG